LKPIALFGGSFDPVHYGHIGLARAAFVQLEVQSMAMLPAGNPYQKGRLPFASATHRANMLRLAFPADSQVLVDERELLRSGATYTFDTLVEWRVEVGERKSLVWLIGSDTFSRVDSWHRWRELFGLAHFAVIDRSTDKFAKAKCSAEFLKEVEPRFTGVLATHTSPSGSVVFLGSPPPPVSSTEIREKIARGESIRGLTPDAVCDYIEQHKLYLPKE
jgi:nicotinate-nucleotide adenylyltransferase